MNKWREVFNLMKKILYFSVSSVRVAFQSLRIDFRKIYYSIIEKLRFSLSLKITLVHARKTLSILTTFTMLILVGFALLSFWNAQNLMAKNYALISTYVEETGFEERMENLLAFDRLSVTIFDEDGLVLYTTENRKNSIYFYEKEALVDAFSINKNYILALDSGPMNYNFIDSLKDINHEEQEYSYGYAMILLEKIEWHKTSAHIQIKNRMIRETTAFIWLAAILLGINLILTLDVLFSGMKSSRKILRPIETMTKTVENITINELNTRLNISGSQDELKDLARNFNNMLDRIQKSYDQQKQFVSDASHELRTPISVIQGYADLLNRWGKDDEKILEESLLAIKEESENMKSLVEKLLFLARSDQNTQKVEKTSFYLNELIEEIVKETRLIDEEHHILCVENEDIFLNADQRLIKEALRIFIDNCIKYTPHGGSIKIGSKVKENKAILSIEDTGIGIPKEDLPNIFNRFYRVDKSRTKGTKGVEGTGLGLSIANWIIKEHHGDIQVESEINQGTKITISLPLYCK
ncbi:sensor histidine kinase [Alkaliphilus oremlandii]|uniref:histidine kinase n=1 Tax=Alkaliphilus oremlandii (strain OhILAs) TaxID=350688 RepID=A8MFV3_ALKOO|nr:ATP-binding protein [Alkaliphilus oremlandii]ABW18491.1 integral membrane sensor signal transduction histidine kinase [Alkaliphilus oremlandii OhILAs]